MILTSSDKDDVLRFSEYLTENHIKHIANHGLNRQGEETIHIIPTKVIILEGILIFENEAFLFLFSKYTSLLFLKPLTYQGQKYLLCPFLLQRCFLLNVSTYFFLNLFLFFRFQP